MVLFISESPGPPSDVRVSNVTNTSAVLSWSPPVNDGGRPLSEIFYTITATGEWHSNDHGSHSWQINIPRLPTLPYTNCAGLYGEKVYT